MFNRPDAPRTLQNYPKETNEKSIYLSWEDGVSDGGLPVMGYKVQVFTDSNSQKKLKTESTTERKIRIQGLTANQQYFISVISTNEIGDSAASELIPVTAENYATPPGPPVLRND